jgi:sugar phosphate isomerase/epimerase
MRLGIIAEPNEEGFHQAAAHGLDFIEICHNVGRTVDSLTGRKEEILGLIERSGVKIGSIGRWGVTRIDDFGGEVEEELKGAYDIIDFCKEIGCPVYVVGVNYVKELSFFENIKATIALLEKLVEYGAQRGVKIATNNCEWGNYVRKPEIWKLVHGHIKELGIKYDPSHCINEHHGDYLQETIDWGKRFYHVHIKGTININNQHIDDPPAGMDMINWPIFMGILYQQGYKEGLSIEPHSGTWSGELGAWGVAYTVDYMKKLIF